MKYREINIARQNFKKYDSEYLGAKTTIEKNNKELQNKNIRLDSGCPRYIVNSLLSKLVSFAEGKEELSHAYNLAKTYLIVEKMISDFEKTGDKSLIDDRKNLDFTNAKNAYFKAYQRKISCPADIVGEFLFCLKKYATKMQKLRNDTLENAKSIVSESKTNAEIKLSAENLRYTSTRLPYNLYIGQHIGGEDKFSKELFSEKESPVVSLNLTNRGNLYVNDYDNSSREIDKFITSYIYSCLNRFPLGALKIHIVDKNPNLTTIIENKLSGNLNKKIITSHKDFSVLDNLKDVVCKDMFKKIGSDCRNVYELYAKDSSESLNLVIIKAPLGESSDYEMHNTLGKIAILTGDYGHNCGIRFLIIDTAKKEQKEIKPNEKLKIIKSNCGILIEKENGKYSIAGLNFKPIYFTEDEFSFIEKQSNVVLELLSKKQKVKIAYEDIINVKEKFSSNDPILRIPIGKSANKIIEMPFSCKNVSNTAEGMCVSYMVIGATGSGKSSLFDSIVMCGSLKYSPSELQFWLLDFKDGIATEKYKSSRLPHISVVADKNSPSDAISLIQMIKSEMEKRQVIFSRYSGCSDIYTFNQYAEKNNEAKMPRIIIMIDEIQELMNCEYQSEIIQELISVSNRIRAFGIHLVMVAQNLSDGRNNHLQEVLSQANGRICFRIDSPETLRNSSMGEAFTERYNEIKNLGQGEIYFKYGNIEPIKLQLAFVPPTSFEGKYFPLIKEKYKNPSRTRIVGALDKLMVDTYSGYLRSTYSGLLSNAKKSRLPTAILGENAYSHEPLAFTLTDKETSGICFIGSNKEMSNCLILSTLASLMGKKYNMHIFNGDNSSVIKEFVNKVGDEYAFYRTRGELLDTISSVYAQFIDRRKTEDDEIEADNEPIIIVINDVTGIRAIREATPLEGVMDANGYAEKTINAVLNELATQGYRYNIFVIMSITEDTFDESIISNIKKLVVFHNTSYTPTMVNTILYSDTMQSIMGGGENALAILLQDKQITKFRPIQYDYQNHEKILINIAKGLKNEEAISKYSKSTYKGKRS